MNKLQRLHCKTNKSDMIPFSWSELLKNPARKALTIGVVLSILGPLSGCGTIASFAGKIFEETGSTISPSTSMIIITVVQFTGLLFETYFVDRAGRRVKHKISSCFKNLWRFFYFTNIFFIYFFSKSFVSDFVHCINKWNYVGFGPFGYVYDA